MNRILIGRDQGHFVTQGLWNLRAEGIWRNSRPSLWFRRWVSKPVAQMGNFLPCTSRKGNYTFIMPSIFVKSPWW